MTDTHDEPSTHGSAHDHEHPAHLAHHFETPQQQFDTAKLGMWVFLATELLMFGGLFCAYAIYRGNHPEVFEFAHRALDTSMGATNTAVLILSSFTMAVAVRASELGQKKLLVTMLALTFLGGTGFMVIKGIEYTTKWQHNMFAGGINVFYQKDGQFQHTDEIPHAVEFIEGHSEGEAEGGGEGQSGSSHGQSEASASHGESSSAEQDSTGQHAGSSADRGQSPSASLSVAGKSWPPKPPSTDQSNTAVPHAAPVGVAAGYADAPQPESLINELVLGTNQAPVKSGHEYPQFSEMSNQNRQRTHIFFQIYFLMTGLHGIHVLVGMGAIAVIGVMAFKGKFGPEWYTPVDCVGLYWHLVDVIWIFLFPLLYLIH